MGKSYGAGCRRTETTGRGVTCCESGSLGALCHGFPLLFPHFMAIAWMCREDYARAGYLNSTFGRAERSFCGLAELGCFAGSYPAGFDSEDRWRIRARLFGRGAHTWFDIFLLQCRLCLSQVECRGAKSAHWFNRLSSHGVYSGDAW